MTPPFDAQTPDAGKPGCDAEPIRAALVEVTAVEGGVRLLYGGGVEPNGKTTLCTDLLEVEVDDQSRVTVRDLEGLVLVQDVEPPTAQRVVRSTPKSEHFYGFGEKTGALDRRGRRLVFWNTDAYDTEYGGYAPGHDPLYLSIPFFIGLREQVAYGVFTDNTHRQTQDIAAENPERYTIEVEGGVIDQTVLAGPQIREVVRRYTAITGRTPLPPRWALGFHQSRWGYAPDTQVLDIAETFLAKDIPIDVLWLDIQHFDDHLSFTWDPETFPDPTGMMQELLGMGIRTIVIQDPGIGTQWSETQALIDDGLVLEHDGGPFLGHVWPGECVFPDFTSEAARAWWGGKVAEEIALGASGIWLDVNEPTLFPEGGTGASIPDDLVTASGETMGAVHNKYALLEAQATFEGLAAQSPDKRPFILTRAGYAGIQKYAAVWTGDAPSRWHDLRESLAMLMNLGLSGVPFVGSDVGGYSGGATAELFARWMLVGAISPFFRSHVTKGVEQQEPWAFVAEDVDLGLEVEGLSRTIIKQRYALLPYLYSLFAEAQLTGAPVLRPLVYEFQSEPELAGNDRQAMLGPFVMAAPVLDQGALEVAVTFPAGRWFEFHSGAIVEGPTTLGRKVPLGALPLYVREGAVIPHTAGIDVYPGAEPSTFVQHQDAGDGFGDTLKTSFQVERTELGARLTVTREGAYVPENGFATTLRFRRVDFAPEKVLLGGEPMTSGWSWDEDDLALLVELDEAGDYELELFFDTSIPDPAPPVSRKMIVTLPEGTPEDTVLHIATDFADWEMVPLGDAVLVPRGKWFEYKYTRGDWCSVEKWPECKELTKNRYAIGAAHPAKEDTVWGWRDWCEACE